MKCIWMLIWPEKPEKTSMAATTVFFSATLSHCVWVAVCVFNITCVRLCVMLYVQCMVGKSEETHHHHREVVAAAFCRHQPPCWVAVCIVCDWIPFLDAWTYLV